MIIRKIVFDCIWSLLILLFILTKDSKCSRQGEQVATWANQIGNSLWDLGKAITNVLEIQETYKHYNAQTERKDPKDLLEEIRANIYRMLDRKMDAIRCIQQKAEEVSEFFEFNRSFYQYYSSKYSPAGDDPIELPKSLTKNEKMYLRMKLNNDTHFYNIAVNTTHSSVHVPTNVYDQEDEAAFAIQWSEYLDEVFVRNYNSDPALSWQYFGSSSGIMRHYPAKKWNTGLFDCRIRTWFIEAATCTKDVVILIDNSGSMDGMGKHIASLTANSILDTFSNNDYVNVMNYSEKTNYTVPCFENMLVQATAENIKVFKEAIKGLDPDGKTRLNQALEKAFELLNDYREKRRCNEVNNTNCNQAIMIITDGISGNLSDIILQYNHLHNDTNIPVRLFTYLIGKEVTNEAELQWISCANRGYYTHVQSLEQVTASVLQYINVIARPLVLQSEEHPVSWTHAYVDLTYDDAKDNTVNEPYRLLTSAAIPCFDKKTNRNNETRTANLLGVAATDVPIDDFRKLTLPYKIGVGGYAFMVSNNGYVLMHPDLRPGYQGILKVNYNSIDITEVEQIDDGKNPREISDIKKLLRASLVNGSEGSMHSVTLKYHFNDMRRVSKETYDYYFAPLEGTPFSLAIALPGRFGNFSLKVPDVINQNKHTGTQLTNFFAGNWKIHPKWVYCKYHYLEGHEFDTPEDELVHFLGKMYETNFRWERQYEPSKNEDLSQVECGRKTLENDDYYCDRQLVERLIFDARTTLGPFKKDWLKRKPEVEKKLINSYNVTLRFVATMSGLTRWDYVNKDEEEITDRNFGDIHARAIDETWYKSAVLQRQYDADAFVYSVPYDVGDDEDNLVTSSHAIFASDAGIETPGSVVGYQFSHKKLKEKADNVTARLSNYCRDCGRCNTSLHCYIVDSSGYIIVSLKEGENDTGKFFGEKEGDIFTSLLENKIFEEVIIYDLQALCKHDPDSKNSANFLLTPLNMVSSTINWLIIKFVLYVELYNIWNPHFILPQNIDAKQNSTPKVEEKPDPSLYYACEKESRLYILDQHKMSEGVIEYKNVPNKRSYYIKAVPKSNLIFIAIDNTILVSNKKVYTTIPQVIENGTILACQKRDLNELHRRRLTGCFNEHPLEHEIKECGRAYLNKLNFVLLFISMLLLFCI